MKISEKKTIYPLQPHHNLIPKIFKGFRNAFGFKFNAMLACKFQNYKLLYFSNIFRINFGRFLYPYQNISFIILKCILSIVNRYI